MEKNKLQLITAGAGSGKTYTISRKVQEYISDGGTLNEVILTTFTKKAAKELRERIKKDLIARGFISEAQKTDSAWIGTVHAIGKKMIDLFTFEARYAPNQEVIPEEDENFLFAQATSEILVPAEYKMMNDLAEKFNVINWQQDMIEIIKKARENDINLESDHNAIADRSTELFMDICGTNLDDGGCSDWNGVCKELETIEETLNLIEGKALKIAISIRDELIPELLSLFNTVVPLDSQARLEEIISTSKKLKITHAKYGGLFGEVKNHITNIEIFLFRISREWCSEDYGIYLHHLFSLATKVHDQYHKFKKYRGLLDYADQENEFLHLLDSKHVKGYVNNRFKLMLVDEFQDTNPMQLAIFMQLSTLVEEVYFVGDPKQSIYSFRGTDPVLIDQVSQSITGTTTLKTSHRSRTPLVHFSNHLFKSVFTDLPEENIVLKPWEQLTEDASFGPAIQLWRPENEKANQDTKRMAIIGKLKRSIEQEVLHYRDKESKVISPVGYGQVAILCRSNADVQNWAERLEAAGIKVSAECSGFHQQAEIVFTLAALSYLADDGNTLALAEMMLLAESQFEADAGKLIDHRLNNLANEDARWLMDQPLIKRLDEEKEMISKFGIQEAIEQLIIQLNIYGLCARWGKQQGRKANLQKLLSRAASYENRCLSYSLPISLHGFLQWIKSDASLKQAAAVSREAVTIMTYHGAKGLEWPVVILDGLEKKLRTSWWGINIGTNKDALDIHHPLKSRLMTFVPNPFGYAYSFMKNEDAYNDAPGFAEETIIDSVYFKNKQQLGFEESKRLLYVGITRARDYLIIPSAKENPEGWWSQTGNTALPGFMANDKNFLIGNDMHVTVESLPIIDEASLQAPEEPQAYFKNGAGVQMFTPKYLRPSDLIHEHANDALKINLNQKAALKTERLCSGLNENDLGDALHSIFAIWRNEGNGAIKQRIHRIMEGYGLHEKLEVPKVDATARAFFDWIHETYANYELLRELPLSMWKDGQKIHGFADLVLKAENDIVLVDYKSYQGADVLKHAAKYVGQLDCYKHMLVEAFQRPVSAMLIYYPVTGSIISMNNN